MGCYNSKAQSSTSQPVPPPAVVLNEDERGVAEPGEAAVLPQPLLTNPCNANGNSASKGVQSGASNADVAEVVKNPSPGNRDLVCNLQKAGVLTKDSVEKAMLATDRLDYAPREAYVDAPQPIGMGATISAPHMHAHALELLASCLLPGARVLDIGCGSGYLSACMARMVGPRGIVIGVDHLEPLVDLSISNVKKSDADLLESGRLLLLHGDGWKGCPEDAPFDCIHVGAAAEEVPAALLEQLKPGGRMVIPVGTQSQWFYQIDRKLDGEYTNKKLMCVRYVPLVKVPVAAACSRMSKEGKENQQREPTRESSTAAEQAVSTSAWRPPAAAASAADPALAEAVICEESAKPERAACGETKALEAAAGQSSPEVADPERASPGLEVKVHEVAIAEPSSEVTPPVLKVQAAPSVEPSDARCAWCAELGLRC